MPTFILRLVPARGQTTSLCELRQILKRLLRTYKLKCVDAREEADARRDDNDDPTYPAA
jgi:hypothetical protein